MTNSCRASAYDDRGQARTASRRTKMATQIKTDVKLCDGCGQWHLVSNDERVDEIDRQILFKIAQGLRAHEIAADLGIQTQQVAHRVEDLTHVFNALSRANLIAAAIWFKIVDLEAIMPTFEEKANGNDSAV